MIKTEFGTTISPAKVAKVLWAVAGVLLLLSIAGQFAKYFLGKRHLFGLIEEFNVDEENNIPTYFATVLLLLSASLLALIASAKAKTGDSFTRHWMVLSGIFLFLSIDEAASLHERLMSPIRDLLGVGGWLRFAWVIPGMIFVAVFALSYLKFLFHLPKRPRLLFVLAGCLYVDGAIGLEMIGGHHAEFYRVKSFTYGVITTIEEGLEMSGIIVFIYALLVYISMRASRHQFVFKEPSVDRNLANREVVSGQSHHAMFVK